MSKPTSQGSVRQGSRDTVCQPRIGSGTAIDFSAHNSDCNSSSEVQDPLGLTEDSSGQMRTASGAINYIQVSAFEDLHMEQDALVNKSDENDSQNETPCNPKPQSNESLDSGIHSHSTDQSLHESAQLEVPSFSNEVLESSEEESSCKSHGAGSINPDIKNCKSEIKSVLLRHLSPDLMASRSQLVSQSCPADESEACPPPLITILSSNGCRTIAKEDECPLSEAVSVLTLFKIPSLSEIMPGSSKDFCLGKALYPVDSERRNPCGKGKQLKVRASQSSSRNGTLACVRIQSYPYSHRTLVTPVVLPLDSYKACLSAMGFASPWTDSEVSGLKYPKNGLSKLLYTGTRSNHGMSHLLNHLDAIACRLIPNSSSVKNVLPLMRYHRAASKPKYHHHTDSKWPPLNTGLVFQLPFPKLKMDTCGPVMTQENRSLYSKQSGDLTPSNAPLHLLTMTQPFQTPKSIVREGNFSGTGLTRVMPIPSPPTSRQWLYHPHPPFSFTSSSFSLVDTVKNQIRAQTSCSPLRPLADYTGPPGLDNDHRSVIQLMLVTTLPVCYTSAQSQFPTIALPVGIPSLFCMLPQ